MSLKNVSASNAVALQAALLVQEGLSFYYVPGSLRSTIDAILGPILTAVVASGSPATTSTVTAYASLAALTTAVAAATAGQIDTLFATLPPEGPQWVAVVTNQVNPIGALLGVTRASGATLALTTATSANVGSVTLTRGRWLVSGNVNFILTGGTTTNLSVGSSTVSATLPAADIRGVNEAGTVALSGTIGLTVPTNVFDIGANTAMNLVAFAIFSAGTVSAYGNLVATRIQ